MTVEEYRRITQGKVNHAQGARFEEQIEAACIEYWAKGIAKISKSHEPMKPIRSLGAGKFMAIYTSQSGADFTGTLAGGQAVRFEAKHTDSDRIKQDAVRPQQWEDLDGHEQLGALCFVLVSIDYKVHRVPWQEWKNMKQNYGHKYMNALELEKYQVPYKQGIYLFLE